MTKTTKRIIDEAVAENYSDYGIAYEILNKIDLTGLSLKDIGNLLCEAINDILQEDKKIDADNYVYGECHENQNSL